MVRQLAGEELSDSDQAFDYWADHMERLPMYFQTFFGSTDIKRVLNLIDYSIYAYNVTHIILDNLQFMLSGQGKGFERFELQDDLISQLRTIATERNVHITLVIHPKKTEDNQDLHVSSIFGTSKATQEADNIFIIQNRSSYKLLDIKKNRYDGEIGRVGMIFNRENKKFETINNAEAEKLIAGADPREILKLRTRDQSKDIARIIQENFGPFSAELKLSISEHSLEASAPTTNEIIPDPVLREPLSALDELTQAAEQAAYMPREPSPVERAIEAVTSAAIEFPADSMELRGFRSSEVSRVSIPTEQMVSFDEHFLNLEDLEVGVSTAEIAEEGDTSSLKWTRGVDSSVNFFVDQGPVMTYDDIMNEYVNKKVSPGKYQRSGQRRPQMSENLFEEYLSNSK